MKIKRRKIEREGRSSGPKRNVVKTSSDVEAYCVKCKQKQIMDNPKKVVMKNGRPARKGKCPVCGSGMFRIGG
jgi:hypothetical protein